MTNLRFTESNSNFFVDFSKFFRIRNKIKNYDFDRFLSVRWRGSFIFHVGQRSLTDALR